MGGSGSESPPTARRCRSSSNHRPTRANCVNAGSRGGASIISPVERLANGHRDLDRSRVRGGEAVAQAAVVPAGETGRGWAGDAEKRCCQSHADLVSSAFQRISPAVRNGYFKARPMTPGGSRFGVTMLNQKESFRLVRLPTRSANLARLPATLTLPAAIASSRVVPLLRMLFKVLRSSVTVASVLASA